MIIATAAIGTRKPDVVFRDSLFSDTANVRTYSKTINLGAEAPSRLIVVGTACATGSEEAPTACTVDGVSATLAVQNTFPGVIAVPQQLWYVARPTGGSVTVAFSKPGGADMDAGSMAVWSVYYLRSHTPRATNTDASNTNPSSVDLTVLANSAVFGCAALSNSNSTTWSLTGLTADATDGTPTFQSAYGSADLVAAGARTIQFAGRANRACSAYWR